MEYEKLLQIINEVSVPEAFKWKLLRLFLGELGQSTFEARRLDKAFLMGEARNHLNTMWGAEENILSRNNQPVHEAAEDLPYRDELNHLQQKHALEPRNTSNTIVCMY